MPFDGSGTYTPAAAPNFPAVGGAVISSTYYNAVINDIATAFNNCLTRDGQGKPSGAISWNNQNLTGVNSFSAATATFTNALGVASGGTGVDASAAANGALLIGNGSGLTLATLTAGAGISIVNSAGGITIQAVGGGAVSSVDVSGGTTGLTFSGGPITTAGTITMAGTLAVANGGTGGTTAALARTALGAAASGALTASGLTIATARLAGRTTASAGALEEISVGATLSLAAGALSVLSVPNSLTFNNGGAGGASGQVFNGTSAITISYNTLGAQPVTPRVQSAASGDLTPTASDDICIRTALSAGININAPTGSPVQGQGMVFRLEDNGTSRTLTWNAIYRAFGSALPTATTLGKILYVGLIYNSTDTKWDVVSVSEEV